MSRRWLLGSIGALLGALILLTAPMAMRGVGFFRVRQVELIGVRYHAPERVLAALQLAPDENVFASRRTLRRRLEGLPGIVRVRVTRKMPGTLKVTVEERTPVAFAPTPDGLVALDARGQPLAYDPTAAVLDLPIVDRVDSVLVRALATIQSADSALFQRIDAVRRTARGGIQLELGQQRMMLRAAPTADEMRMIAAVHRDLSARGQGFELLDARFAGQVVVRRSGA